MSTSNPRPKAEEQYRFFKQQSQFSSVKLTLPLRAVDVRNLHRLFRKRSPTREPSGALFDLFLPLPPVLSFATPDESNFGGGGG